MYFDSLPVFQYCLPLDLGCGPSLKETWLLGNFTESKIQLKSTVGQWNVLPSNSYTMSIPNNNMTVHLQVYTACTQMHSTLESLFWQEGILSFCTILQDH